ncbi:MarR family winged helix-turn-helix transcriptional regulator [Nocardia sienata]|uniref:MarR family winged helix-turn-helix transcriptional regulator n=1 Tax=Nocardia sienata TaxID=248552 RepID=UPI000B1DEE26|nr:MarR family transcriptional regulator [Nocardia sienata]
MSAAAHRLGGQLDDLLASLGFAEVRAAQAQIFLAVDGAGTRAGVLAQRTHMTKQAMAEQVGRLERAGYLEVVADPDDRRARLVRLTKKGEEAVEAAATAVDMFDRWLVSRIGTTEVDALRATLELILASAPTEWNRHHPPSGTPLPAADFHATRADSDAPRRAGQK